MNCPDCDEALQRWLDGAPRTADLALDEHLAECPACRERHAAARRLQAGLAAMARPAVPDGFAPRVLAVVLRDRQRRQTRMRRRLYVTAALAASIVLMLLIGYCVDLPWQPARTNSGPVARDAPAMHNAVVPDLPSSPERTPEPVAVPQHEPEKPERLRDDGRNRLAALTGRIANKTLDQAIVLWTVTNPAESLPMGELPNVPELDPAAPVAQPLRQARQEVSAGLQAVTRSARQAFDYFAREMPMLDLPPEPEPK